MCLSHQQSLPGCLIAILGCHGEALKMCKTFSLQCEFKASLGNLRRTFLKIKREKRIEGAGE